MLAQFASVADLVATGVRKPIIEYQMVFSAYICYVKDFDASRLNALSSIYQIVISMYHLLITSLIHCKPTP
jgi:hypothetical protein